MIRTFDFIASAMALLFFIPFLVFIIIILRFSGEGEIFYRQKRVGKNGKIFDLLKFATMKKGSVKIGTGYITLHDDPRVLLVGKFLRKTKINELPQLWNVLWGEMSLIGPRPQAQYVVKLYEKVDFEAIKKVRPGLSGIGSIYFRDEERIFSEVINPIDYDNKVIIPYKGKLERWYCENINFTMYFTLILLTFYALFRPVKLSSFKLFEGLPSAPLEIQQSWKI